jgi:hypothetical protein
MPSFTKTGTSLPSPPPCLVSAFIHNIAPTNGVPLSNRMIQHAYETYKPKDYQGGPQRPYG